MTRLTDGKMIVEVEMQERNCYKSELGCDFSNDFFSTGRLEYDPWHDAYIVDDCDLIVDTVTDWRNGIGDYADDEYEEREATILTYEIEEDEL